jgi:hypothetical protein
LTWSQPRKTKFNNAPQIWNGERYDSKRELEYAMYLYGEIEQGRIRWWRRQVPIQLTVNDQKICKLVVDFLVGFPDGRQEYHEVKSAATKTPMFNLKLKLLRALHPELIYRVIQ